jgi:hypothetical protein
MDQENVVLVHNEFFSAMKKNEILSFAGKWMELENIILSEDQKLYVLRHMWTLDLGKMQQCGWTWITRQGKITYWRYRNK